MSSKKKKKIKNKFLRSFSIARKSAIDVFGRASLLKLFSFFFLNVLSVTGRKRDGFSDKFFSLSIFRQRGDDVKLKRNSQTLISPRAEKRCSTHDVVADLNPDEI